MLFLVWVPWIYYILTLDMSKIDESLIFTRMGLVSSAQCYRSRTSTGVDFKVRYDDSASVKKDFIILPFSCDADLLDLFINKRIEITGYKNSYLGLIADGTVILPLREAIDSRNNDKFSIIYFPLSVTIISFLAILAKFYHSTKRRQKVTRKGIGDKSY